MEYGSYSTSRACTPTCTAGWEAGSSYTYNNITWSGTCLETGIESGTSAGRSRTWVNANCTTETRTEQGPFAVSRGCTYTPPAACVCNYTTTPTQSYHFAPECCAGGSARAGSLSGTTTNACCPNVTKTATGKYACKAYDVTNSASTNYSTCYTEGSCDARYNSDGSRAACYA